MPAFFNSPIASPCRRQLRFDDSFNQQSSNSMSVSCSSEASLVKNLDPEEELRQHLRQSISTDWSRLSLSACLHELEVMRSTADGDSFIQLPEYYSRQPTNFKSNAPGKAQTDLDASQAQLQSWQLSHDSCGRPRSKKRKVSIDRGDSTSAMNQFNSCSYSNSAADTTRSYMYSCGHRQLSTEFVMLVEIGTF